MKVRALAALAVAAAALSADGTASAADVYRHAPQADVNNAGCAGTHTGRMRSHPLWIESRTERG